MTICPYCEQGVIIKAKVKKIESIIRICPECDTIWEGDVSSEEGCGFSSFAKNNGLINSWDELEIIE
ncbi:MAG: hypothetical protein IIT48_10885 [Lachnospiraceae bacterium]|nr:hypothetical protein [Lachnospiraceae bacterium]